MYLFDNQAQGLGRQSFLPLGGTVSVVIRKKQTLLEALTGEEQPRSIGSLLFVLVLLLHVLTGLWLSQPKKPVTPAQPLMMEVSLVSMPGQKASAVPPAPPKPVEPPEPKKTPAKKPLKKKAPVKHKQAEPPKTAAIVEEAPPAPAPAESSNSKDSGAVSNAAVSASKAQSVAEPYIEASVNANYGFNPPPKYPAIAKRRGWQGTVRLRVSVSAEGYSEDVAIQSSSGHEELDAAAVKAVRKWRFNPAKRGNTAVASFVIVPINFTLEH